MTIGACMNFCTFYKSVLVPQINRQSLLWGPVCNCFKYCQGVPWKSVFPSLTVPAMALAPCPVAGRAAKPPWPVDD